MVTIYFLNTTWKVPSQLISELNSNGSTRRCSSIRILALLTGPMHALQYAARKPSGGGRRAKEEPQGLAHSACMPAAPRARIEGTACGTWRQDRWDRLLTRRSVTLHALCCALPGDYPDNPPNTHPGPPS